MFRAERFLSLWVMASISWSELCLGRKDWTRCVDYVVDSDLPGGLCDGN